MSEGRLLLGIGGLLATGGGLLILLLGVAMKGGGHDKDLGALVLGGAIMGGLPLILGLWLFRIGVRRLNQAVPARV